ncbi:MAG: DUF1624 domain-containing protein [Fibrobacterales bacterium]
MNQTLRIHGLDFFRGIALILMVEQHLGSWLWRGILPGETFNDYPVIVILSILGGLAAPFFITATAYSSLLLFHKNPSWLLFAKRGLLLIIFGYILNLLVPSWFSMKSWYILHFLGVMLIITPFLIKRSSLFLGLCASSSLILYTTFITHLSIPDMLSNTDMSGTSLYMKVFPFWEQFLRISFIQGQFSLLSWAPLYLLSLSLFKPSINPRPNVHFFPVITKSLLIQGCGVLLMVTGYFIQDLHIHPFINRLCSPSPLFYPISPGMLLFLTGTATMILSLLMRLPKRQHSLILVGIESVGRSSLTLLFVHILLFRELLISLGFFRSTSETTALLMTLLTLLALLVTTTYWKKYSFKYGLEWLMRKW